MGTGISGDEGEGEESCGVCFVGLLGQVLGCYDALEELVLAEKEGVMDFEEEISSDLCVGDPVEKLVAEAERKVKLALEEAEMAAAEAESCEMELEMLLKELGLRG